uniref:Uncharacterized protein n=1 Tax=Caenorhabditis japonica TaxID=281687 RepID=A0A8R1IVZ5_CAEJA
MGNKHWKDGPVFVKLPRTEWPIRLQGTISYSKESSELIKKEVEWQKQGKPKALKKATVQTVSPIDQDPKSIVRYQTVRSFDKLTTTMEMVLR